MKKCRVCKKSKSSASFNKKPDNSGGLNTMCKKCQSEYSKSITKKNSKRKEIKIPKFKICGKCGVKKSSNEFSKNICKNICKNDGLCGYCKKCDTKKAASVRKNNRNRKRIDIPKEKLCVKCYIIKNKEGFTKNRSSSDGLNPYCKTCTSNIMCAQNNTRREIKISINEVFTEEDVRIVKDACSWMCILCGSHDNLSVDHFKPLSKMNPLRIGNAIILCTSCNSKKHNKDPKEFFDDKMYQIALSCIAISDILKNGVG